MKKAWLAAKVIDEPENQADRDADDQAGDKRKIKCAVLAAMDDVAGQPAETQREFWAEVEKCADQDEHGSGEEKQAAELLRWFHNDSVARALKD